MTRRNATFIYDIAATVFDRRSDAFRLRLHVVTIQLEATRNPIGWYNDNYEPTTGTDPYLLAQVARLQTHNPRSEP